MKIVVTGSLGYVSKPLTEKLLRKGHSVTVVSSNPERKAAIEALGATAAIGNMSDVDFLTDTFNGADAVYCMLAPFGNSFDPNTGADTVIKQADAFVNNYLQAIHKTGVKRVVYLSSIGAEMKEDNGLLIIHHRAENTLNTLPSDVAVSFIRPAGFYKNLFLFIRAIQDHNIIAANYGGTDRVVWVSNTDIADVIMEEIESKETGRKIRYVASEELTCNEAASILGAAVGKPELKWPLLTNEQQLNGFIAFGMNESVARYFVEMNESIHNGKLYKEYDRHKPVMGKVKMKEFAGEFAAIYRQ